MRIILLLLCAVVCAFAQTPDYGRDMQGPFRLYRGTTTPATCTVGDLFFDTDATAGSNVFGCTATNTWNVQSGALAAAFSSATTVSYSATPTFTVPSASTNGAAFKITLTGNVTSSTLASATNGQTLHFVVCQDATGGRSFTWPANVIGGMTISASRNSAASTCYQQTFVYDGTNAYGRREINAGGNGHLAFDQSGNIDTVAGALVTVEDDEAVTGLKWFPPSTTQSITAVGDTILANARNISVSPTSALTLTSTPSIANGQNGQLLRLCNVNTSNTLTIQDEAVLTGSNIRAGGSNVTIGTRQCRELVYSTALGDWSVIPAGGLSSLSGQSFTWAEDTQYWPACFITPGGTATGGDFMMWADEATVNDAVATNLGSLTEISNRFCGALMAFHASDAKYIYKNFIVPAGFTSLDLYLQMGSTAGGAGSGVVTMRAAYRTFGAAGNPHASTTAFTTTNSQAGTFTNVSGEQTFITITSAVTVAQCPVGSFCQVRIERVANSAYTGGIYLYGVKPIFNITRTL